MASSDELWKGSVCSSSVFPVLLFNISYYCLIIPRKCVVLTRGECGKVCCHSNTREDLSHISIKNSIPAAGSWLLIATWRKMSLPYFCTEVRTIKPARWAQCATHAAFRDCSLCRRVFGRGRMSGSTADRWHCSARQLPLRAGEREHGTGQRVCIKKVLQTLNYSNEPRIKEIT